MKKLIGLALATCVSFAVQAKEVGSVTLPDTMKAGDQELTLNGAGVRSKFFMDIYSAGLYLPQQQKDAKAIVSADKPMALRLHITSGLLSGEKMVAATNEGFEKSTHGNTKPIQASIDKLINAFKADINPNDVFDLVYKPGVGVEVYKNGQLKTAAEGLEFKKALFGIWLSDEPVQSDLKSGLLGG